MGAIEIIIIAAVVVAVLFRVAESIKRNRRL
jgi:hypothetical protein